MAGGRGEEGSLLSPVLALEADSALLPPGKAQGAAPRPGRSRLRLPGGALRRPPCPGGSAGLPREGTPSSPDPSASVPAAAAPGGTAGSPLAAGGQAPRPGPARSRPPQRRLGQEPAGGARPGRRRLRPSLPHGRGRPCRREEKLPLRHPPPPSAPPAFLLLRGYCKEAAERCRLSLPGRGAAGARAQGSPPAGQPRRPPRALSYPGEGARQAGSGGGGLRADEGCSCEMLHAQLPAGGG